MPPADRDEAREALVAAMCEFHHSGSDRVAVAMAADALADLILALAAPREPTAAASTEAIPMRLPCPGCGELHIDEGEFATKLHHTHSCQSCGLTWRPAVVPTVGVRFLPGFKNEPTAAAEGGGADVKHSPHCDAVLSVGGDCDMGCAEFASSVTAALDRPRAGPACPLPAQGVDCSVCGPAAPSSSGQEGLGPDALRELLGREHDMHKRSEGNLRRAIAELRSALADLVHAIDKGAVVLRSDVQEACERARALLSAGRTAACSACKGSGFVTVCIDCSGASSGQTSIPCPACAVAATAETGARSIDELREWCVWDSWQSRWCPRPNMTYLEADRRAAEYNEREAIGSKRYVALRRVEQTVEDAAPTMGPDVWISFDADGRYPAAHTSDGKSSHEGLRDRGRTRYVDARAVTASAAEVRDWERIADERAGELSAARQQLGEREATCRHLRGLMRDMAYHIPEGRHALRAAVDDALSPAPAAPSPAISWQQAPGTSGPTITAAVHAAPSSAAQPETAAAAPVDSDMLRIIRTALVNSRDVLDITSNDERHLPEAVAELRKWRDACQSALLAVSAIEHPRVPPKAVRKGGRLVVPTPFGDIDVVKVGPAAPSPAPTCGTTERWGVYDTRRASWVRTVGGSDDWVTAEAAEDIAAHNRSLFGDYFWVTKKRPLPPESCAPSAAKAKGAT